MVSSFKDLNDVIFFLIFYFYQNWLREKLWLNGWQIPFHKYALWFWSLSLFFLFFLSNDLLADSLNLPWHIEANGWEGADKGFYLLLFFYNGVCFPSHKQLDTHLMKHMFLSIQYLNQSFLVTHDAIIFFLHKMR